MYHFKYAKHIQIDKLGYYEPFIDLGCDRVCDFDDATRKYEWKELKSDEDVESMFNSVLVDPKYPCLIYNVSNFAKHIFQRHGFCEPKHIKEDHGFYKPKRI
ncbi:hypothetical protein QL285_079609 [Trifolium repens]|nr:hypothetical protein QL285_079609 [Trifolium repens]